MMIAAAVVAALMAVTSVPPSSEPIPEGYVLLEDSTRSIVITVPEAWSDIEVAPIPLEDGSESPFLAASTDLASLYEGEFTAPGVMYASFQHTDDLLSLKETYGPPRNCELMYDLGYHTDAFFGIVQVGDNCGSQHMTWNMVVANHIGPPHFTVVVQIQTASEVERSTVMKSFDAGPNATAVFVP